MFSRKRRDAYYVSESDDEEQESQNKKRKTTEVKTCRIDRAPSRPASVPLLDAARMRKDTQGRIVDLAVRLTTLVGRASEQKKRGLAVGLDDVEHAHKADAIKLFLDWHSPPGSAIARPEGSPPPWTHGNDLWDISYVDGGLVISWEKSERTSDSRYGDCPYQFLVDSSHNAEIEH